MSNFILLHVDIIFPALLVQKTILSSLKILAPLSKISWREVLFLGSLSYSIGLYLCLYASSTLFGLLELRLKSRSMVPSALFFSRLLWLCMDFCGSIQTSAFYFCEKCYWNFDRDCIESVDSSEECGHLNNINSSNLWTQNIFHLFLSSSVPFINVLQFSISDSFIIQRSNWFLYIDFIYWNFTEFSNLF